MHVRLGGPYCPLGHACLWVFTHMPEYCADCKAIAPTHL